MIKIHGILELDPRRGVIYFTDLMTGSTVLRVSNARITNAKEGDMISIDLIHMHGMSCISEAVKAEPVAAYCPKTCPSNPATCINQGKLCTCDGVNHVTCPHHAVEFVHLPDTIEISRATFNHLVNKLTNS